LLAVLVVAVWFVSRAGWLEDTWMAAPEYDIDALEVLARIKLTGEQGLSLFVDKGIHRLGAPWVADWSSYPMPDMLVFWCLGKLAKVTGLVVIGHLAILLSCLVNALTFFFCSRVLGHRPVFAACAAKLFAFSHYNITRGLSHYSLTLSFTVPAVLLAAWLVGGGRRLLAKRRWQFVCLLVGACTAMGSPYYGLMFVMLMVMALVYQFASGRRRANLLTGLGSLVVWGLVTAACNLTAITGMFTGTRRALHRDYASTEVYGLRPIEWAVPPPYHRMPGASQLTKDYGRVTLFEGEHYTSYLGVIGLCGLALILLVFIRAVLRGRGALRPAHGPTVAFIVAFGMAGGINSVIALTMTPVFRASNRYSVFILAMALLALTAWASLRWRRLRVGAAVLAAVLLAGFGLWDQMRPIPGAEELKERVRGPDVDRKLGTSLEQVLPPGAMIFQVPAVSFPEARPIVGMTDYEHFRPFFFTRTLRFSYGPLASDAIAFWQRRVAGLPVAEMRAELEGAGFAAVYICRSAFIDGALAIGRACQALDLPVLFDAGPHLVFGLTPSATPRLPELSGPNRLESWDGGPTYMDRFHVLDGPGWFVDERIDKVGWRWGGQDAVNVLWNPTGAVKRVRIHCTVMSCAVDELSIRLADGRVLWRQEVQPTGSHCEFQLELPPGETELHWSYRGKPTRVPPPDMRLLGFRVDNLTVEAR
jgi:phosphoglycerol transferase